MGGRKYIPTNVLLDCPQDTPLADLWWACGKGLGLRNTLPKNWKGRCARVAMMQRTTIVTLDDERAAVNDDSEEPLSRHKRAAETSKKGKAFLIWGLFECNWAA